MNFPKFSVFYVHVKKEWSKIDVFNINSSVSYKTLLSCAEGKHQFKYSIILDGA